MTTRRTLCHHRNEKPRSVSKIGLLLCLLLAGGVMVVPASSDIVLHGKAKVRDLALSSGFISFKDCVVTPSHVLSCESGAAGTLQTTTYRPPRKREFARQARVSAPSRAWR